VLALSRRSLAGLPYFAENKKVVRFIAEAPGNGVIGMTVDAYAAAMVASAGVEIRVLCATSMIRLSYLSI